MSTAANLSDPKSLFEEIHQYMRDAQEICDRGEYIELAGLDDRVQQICEAVQALSPEEAKTYETDLSAMIDALNKLQAVFVERRDALSGDLSDSHKHHQAAKAYKQSERTLPQGEPAGEE